MAQAAPLMYGGTPRKLPRVLSPREAQRLLSVPTEIPWHRSAIAIGLYAGLRVSEILNLKVGDFDFEEMTLRVRRGKGRRDSTLPLNPKLTPYVAPLIETLPKDHFLFESYRRPGRPLTRQAFSLAIEAIAISIGLIGVHPHTLRHTYGTELQKRGGDLAKTQRLMRHSNVQSTMLYVHLAVEDVRRLAEELDFDDLPK